MDLYELQTLCSGLITAADASQNDVFKDVINFLLVYLDDNDTFFRSKAEHYKHLCTKLQLPCDHKLHGDLHKCLCSARAAASGSQWRMPGMVCSREHMQRSDFSVI